MSRPMPGPDHKPLIALVDRLNRVLQEDMVRSGRAKGYPELKPAHNALFGTLSASTGSHTADMAAKFGITRQSMGEIVRDLAQVGIVQMSVDPNDRRAKLVTYTDYGLKAARSGRRHIMALEERLAQEFGEEEYARVLDVLARIADIVERGTEG